MSHNRLVSYIVGFLSSVALTLAAYYIAINHAFANQTLIYVIVGLAVVQLIIQVVFFLHIGQEKDGHWKLVSFIFAILVVLIVVGGSLWIMHNLDYNMMNMTPDQQKIYMHNNEGI